MLITNDRFDLYEAAALNGPNCKEDTMIARIVRLIKRLVSTCRRTRSVIRDAGEEELYDLLTSGKLTRLEENAIGWYFKYGEWHPDTPAF